MGQRIRHSKWAAPLARSDRAGSPAEHEALAMPPPRTGSVEKGRRANGAVYFSAHAFAWATIPAFESMCRPNMLRPPAARRLKSALICTPKQPRSARTKQASCSRRSRPACSEGDRASSLRRIWPRGSMLGSEAERRRARPPHATTAGTTRRISRPAIGGASTYATGRPTTYASSRATSTSRFRRAPSLGRRRAMCGRPRARCSPTPSARSVTTCDAA